MSRASLLEGPLSHDVGQKSKTFTSDILRERNPSQTLPSSLVSRLDRCIVHLQDECNLSLFVSL
jgi:hypothetical protein